MSERYRFAVLATQTTDLVELAKFLAGATQEAKLEGQMPHLDPAVRLICFQISFSGNGDLASNGYYDQVYKYCLAKAENAANVDFLQETKDVKPPVHQAS